MQLPLREWRQEAGMTQAELADEAGVSPPLISMAEVGSGRLGIGALNKVVKVLRQHGVEIDLDLYVGVSDLGPEQHDDALCPETERRAS